MTNKKENYSIRFERFEGDEYIITLNGDPIGQTLHYKDAIIVSNWLITAMEEIKTQ